jgi:hypothetical protein
VGVSDVVVLALIAGGLAIINAVVSAWVTARKDHREAEVRRSEKVEAAEERRREKAEDYARQDLVADRVAAAAREVADRAQLLLKAQEDAIVRTDEVARLAEAADTRISLQLTSIDELSQKIHILVNSDMTAARTAERDSLKLLVLALRQTHALNMKFGIPQSEHEEEEIKRVEDRIVELDLILADRHAAQKEVEEEARKRSEKIKGA